jgi:hypothetical protein
MYTFKNNIYIFMFLLNFICNLTQAQTMNYPGVTWTIEKPSYLNMDKQKLDSIPMILKGRGCIVKNGFVVKRWGDQEEKSDWLSSVKPLFSTFLFFAIEEGKISNVHYKIKNLDWNLILKDQSMEFYHLANMISGYARPEKPGKAWAYNDFAIQLYQKSLFEKLFCENPEEVLYNRLGPLQFQDYPTFRNDKPRLYASVRDFARIGWFWLNHGKWNQQQLLPEVYFRKYMKPQVSKKLQNTRNTETNDYLKIGTFGGRSDHFTKYGAGIYGFNWWFNDTGRLHPNSKTWPDATDNTFMTIGARGNNMVMVPEYNLILSSADGNWGSLDAGNSDSIFNRIIQLLIAACIP